MAHFSTTTLSDVFPPVGGDGKASMLVLDTPTGGGQTAGMGANGGLIVEPASGADVATETTVDEVTGASLAASANGVLTKSDSTVYSPPLKVIWATGAGNITAMLADDTASVVTFAVAANDLVTCFRIRKIMAATTATGISGAQ